MFHRGPSATNPGRARHEADARGASRRRRNRLTPGAEALEVRDCPSGLAAQVAVPESAHALHAAQTEARHLRAELRHESLLARREARAEAHHLRARHRPAPHQAHHRANRHRPPSSPLTIYVAPSGRVNTAAGKTSADPLGSLAVALKRAGDGSTIVLAPGVYTQAVGLSGKSGIDIVGAANGSSILAGPGAFAMKIYSSSGITLQDVAIRSPNGSGLAVFGSSVSLVNVSTNGSHADGVVINGGGSVTATASHFDASQTGDGMDVQSGSAAVNGCTFNGNGTAGSSAGGTGLSAEGNSHVTIANSQLVGNVNANLVGYNQSSVTAQGSSFSNSQQGDGAIFSNQATVNLSGDTFASNGTARGYASGFNGVEFTQYSGNAVLSGDTFVNNTASGIFVGGASQALQITGNTFASNLVGLNLDASVAPIVALVAGNTFTTAPGSGDQGLVAAGSGVTATIGGAGTAGNTFQNFASQRSILQYHTSGSSTIGCPNLNIGSNSYTSGGVAESADQAVLPC